MNNQIKVSVCVITYNQERYIQQCLQSLVDQITNFTYEIIVSDDCSTDGTRDIIQEFSNRYPNLIVPILRTRNVGPVRNCIEGYKKAKGVYICHVDGDDFALPTKLQEQADALDKNSDCVICSHDVKIVDNQGHQIRSSFKRHKDGVSTIIDLYEQLPFFAHSSKMFVNDLDHTFWENLHQNALDIEVHIQQAKRGNIFHLDKILGAYRSSTGVSSTTTTVNPMIVDGAIRIFENELKCGSVDKLLVKRFYAMAMLRYAHQSAIVGDKLGIIKYASMSTSIKLFSVSQIIFWLTTFNPSLAILAAKLKHRMRNSNTR